MPDKQNNIASGSAATDTTLQQEVGRNEGQVVGQMTNSQVSSVQEADIVVSSGGSATVYYQLGANGQPHSSSSQSRTIPSLLPYLPNRSDQEFALREAIQAYLQLNKSSPLICIVHGDEFQCHDKFLERIQKLSLPKFFQLEATKVIIKDYPLAWPSGLKSLEKLPDYLYKHLADVVGEHGFASLEEINQAFCKYPYPAIVHTHLLTEDWNKQGARILYELLEFWNRWPQLAPNQQLVICIFVKYQMKRHQKRSPFWFLKPWVLLQAFLKRRKCQKLNQNIQSQIDSLAQSNFSQYENIFGVVLPKLSDISRTHVEDWIRTKSTKAFIGEAMLEQMIGAVRELFDQREYQTSVSTISMDDLAEELIRLLQSISVPK